MKIFRMSRDQEAEIAQALAKVKVADEAVLVKKAARDKVASERDAIEEAIRQFKANGDFRDLQKVTENEARQRQVEFFTRELEAARSEVAKAETAVEGALREAARVVSDIGGEALDFVLEQLVEINKPFFMDEGKARFVIADQFDFQQNLITWKTYFPRGNGVGALRSEVETALQNLRTFGLPENLGCRDIAQAFQS